MSLQKALEWGDFFTTKLQNQLCRRAENEVFLSMQRFIWWKTLYHFQMSTPFVDCEKRVKVRSLWWCQHTQRKRINEIPRWRGVCGFVQLPAPEKWEAAVSNIKRNVIYSRMYNTIWQGNCFQCFLLIQSKKQLSNFCAHALALQHVSPRVWEIFLWLFGKQF